mgnify:CR=1 FL=1
MSTKATLPLSSHHVGHTDISVLKKLRARYSTRTGQLKLLAILSLLSISLAVPYTFFHLQERTISSRQSHVLGEWHDDVFPLRNSTPWDISTDFPYPRKLEYDVTEGTWLRLDVHPKTGDIVFDMVGDIYCLAAKDIKKAGADGGRTEARPVLRGVPHDSDPHFSLEGDRLVFRSDAELGVENIWVMEWKGCEGMDLRTVGVSADMRDADNALLVQGVKETEERRARRLLGEGRLGGTLLRLSWLSRTNPGIQRSALRTRRTDGCRMRGSIPLARRSSRPSGTPPHAPWARAKLGSTLYLPLKTFNRVERGILTLGPGPALLDERCPRDGQWSTMGNSRLDLSSLFGRGMIH